jgi:hypothetical protein
VLIPFEAEGLTGRGGSSLELMIPLTYRYGGAAAWPWIAPGCRPLACAAGVVVGVLATATIAAFEIAGWVVTRQVWQRQSPTACAAMPTFLMVGTPIGANFDVGQVHLRDEPLRVDQSEPPL